MHCDATPPSRCPIPGTAPGRSGQRRASSRPAATAPAATAFAAATAIRDGSSCTARAPTRGNGILIEFDFPPIYRQPPPLPHPPLAIGHISCPTLDRPQTIVFCRSMISKIQVPVKNGTCFTFHVRSNVCPPVKHGTRSGFSKYRNPSFVRNSGGIRQECAT